MFVELFCKLKNNDIIELTQCMKSDVICQMPYITYPEIESLILKKNT